MLLKDKVAVIYGAGGAIGGAVAGAFAREGARLFLSGRNLAPVRTVAEEIAAADGTAEAASVDALDEDAIERHTAASHREGGPHRCRPQRHRHQSGAGIDLLDLKREDFVSPIAAWTTTQFLTARAAARHMIGRRSGVILTLSASPARLAIAQTGGFGVACAAVEGLTRTLAAELGPHGVRVVCIRPHRIGDTLKTPDFPMGA